MLGTLLVEVDMEEKRREDLQLGGECYSWRARELISGRLWADVGWCLIGSEFGIYFVHDGILSLKLAQPRTFCGWTPATLARRARASTKCVLPFTLPDSLPLCIHPPLQTLNTAVQSQNGK